MAQVLGRIAQPLLHEEEVVALGFVMPHVEIDRVAHDQRRGVGGEYIAQQRVAARLRLGSQQAGRHGDAQQQDAAGKPGQERRASDRLP